MCAGNDGTSGPAQSGMLTRAACDRRLHQLVFYIHSSLYPRIAGCVGGDRAGGQPHLLQDADIAGRIDALRSTSGVHLAMRANVQTVPSQASAVVRLALNPGS